MSEPPQKLNYVTPEAPRRSHRVSRLTVVVIAVASAIAVTVLLLGIIWWMQSRAFH